MVAVFITSYLPIPVFLLLLFGYKLIYRTKMVPIDSMPSGLNYPRFHQPVVQEEALDFANMSWRRRCVYYVQRVFGM